MNIVLKHQTKGLHMKKILYLSLLMLNTLNLCATDDWPMVHHDIKNTRHNHNVSISFDDIKNGLLVPQWSAAGSAVQAAPIVVDGRVFYGDSTGNLWAYTTTGTLIQQFTFPNTGEASAAPLTFVDGIIYATSVTAGSLPNGGLRLYAFDTRINTSNPFTPYPVFNGGQPVDIHPGFTGTQANIFAGAVVVDNIVITATSTSNAEENTTLFPTYRGGFHAFNATTGAFQWRTIVSSPEYGPSGGAWSTAAVDEDLHLIFAGTTNATLPPASPLTDALLAIDYRNGEIEWSQQYTEDDVFSFQYACGLNFDVGASPQLFQIKESCGKTHNVVGCGSKAGKYRVFERRTGKPVWVSRMIPKGDVPSVNGNPTSAYHNGFVYTISNNDESGIDFSSLTVLAQYGLQFGDFATIAYLQQLAATTNYTFIRKVNADSGDIVWSNKHVTATLASIAHANGVVYVGDGIGLLRAIDASSGDEVNIANLGNTIGAPITVVGNQVFLGVGIGLGGGLFVYHKP